MQLVQENTKKVHKKEIFMFVIFDFFLFLNANVCKYTKKGK